MCIDKIIFVLVSTRTRMISSIDMVKRHFPAPGHHGLEDVSIKLINGVPHESKLLNKEGQLSHRLKSSP